MCPADDDLDSAEVATDSEVVRYEKAFLATRRTLHESIRNLSLLLELEEDPDRRDQIGEEIVALTGDVDDLSRANIAFHAHNATMVPPSAALVRELTGLADRATALTQERATAAATIRLATRALDKFAEIQKIGSE